MGRGSEEMGAAGEGLIVADQLEVGFVNQGGGVEGVARLFGRQLVGGQPAQFVMARGKSCAAAEGSPCSMAVRMMGTSDMNQSIPPRGRPRNTRAAIQPTKEAGAGCGQRHSRPLSRSRVRTVTFTARESPIILFEQGTLFRPAWSPGGADRRAWFLLARSASGEAGKGIGCESTVACQFTPDSSVAVAWGRSVEVRFRLKRL
jgi:hypothetical protein